MVEQCVLVDRYWVKVGNFVDEGGHSCQITVF